MSTARATMRRKASLTLAGVAAALWATLLLSGLMSPATNGSHAQLGKPVLENFAATRTDAQRIRFTMADDAYTLVRTDKGWVMEDSGNYPIRSDRLAKLATGLETLTFDEKRTNDPYKLDHLGLGAPDEGGNGVLIEVTGSNGEMTAELIVGRKADTIYVRTPGNPQTYRTVGDLPPFYNRRAWLDFAIIDIEPSAISSLRVTDVTGRSVYLKRQPGNNERSFRPAPPNQTDRIRDRLAISSTALAITRLSALDAKPASDLTTPRIAQHISETFDGLEVNLKAHREPDGLWVTLRAIEAGEGARRAQAINDKAEGWAFRISDYDFQDFTPLVSSLVARSEPTVP